MTDLEITKLCAEAMGWSAWRSKHGYWNVTSPDGESFVCCKDWLPFDAFTGDKLPEPTISDAIAECDFDPLHDDAQAMALVKKFNIQLSKSLPTPRHNGGEFWFAHFRGKEANSSDLNRAICECVAQATVGKGG